MKTVEIVLVEDEAIVAMQIKNTLQKMGHTVAGVYASGEEALAAMATSCPELVLMDIKLQGGLDGIETAKRLSYAQDVPIIFLTAHSEGPTLERARATSPYGYMLKPAKEQDLHITIQMALYKHEQDLRVKRMERWQAAILGSIGDAVLTCDTECRVTYMNRRAEEYSGWSADRALGKGLMEVLAVKEMGKATVAAAEQLLAKVVKEGQSVSLFSHRALVAADGAELLVEDSAAPLKDEQGEIIGMVMIFRDITKRIQAEEAQTKLQAQLHQAQKMESVGRLAGGVAHDFNNMLTVVLGHTEIAMAKADASQPFFADLQIIQKAARRSADLTRQLLAFARKQMIAPKVLDLNETVEGMLKILRRLIGEDIDLAWLPGGGLWPVKIDPSQVDQLLANLCVNARDAIGGVGNITIETENVFFDADYCLEHPGVVAGEYVLLATSDNGCGMDRETLANIFEPFFTTKEVGKGTGLGLSTVYGIVKQNKGFVNVYSEPGTGTTFKIYLPRHEDLSRQLDEVEQVTPVVGGQETILLVEDQPELLTMGKIMLEHLGYTVLAAVNPDEALRLAEAHAGKIGMLITDVVMPKMNGLDLARQLQALYPGLRCLFMSGYTANVIAHHGILQGINFIAKPFSSKEIAAKVREVLAQKG